jgi:hypothetical protein
LAVVFVEEAEHGREFLREAREERHCCWCGGEGSRDGCWLADAVEVLWNSSNACAQWLHECLADSLFW